MKFSMITMILLHVPLCALGQGWYWQNPLPQGNSLFDTFVFDEINAIFVGDAGATIPKRDRVDSTWVQEVLSNGTLGKIKDAINLGTIYWPTGDVVSVQRDPSQDQDKISFLSPQGGNQNIDDVYSNDVLVIDYDGGSWDPDDSLEITDTDNQGSITEVTTPAFTSGVPTSSSDFKIRNTYTDASRVVGGYPFTAPGQRHRTPMGTIFQIG